MITRHIISKCFAMKFLDAQTLSRMWFGKNEHLQRRGFSWEPLTMMCLFMQKIRQRPPKTNFLVLTIRLRILKIPITIHEVYGPLVISLLKDGVPTRCTRSFLLLVLFLNLRQEDVGATLKALLKILKKTIEFGLAKIVRLGHVSKPFCQNKKVLQLGRGGLTLKSDTIKKQKRKGLLFLVLITHLIPRSQHG